ncbi:hypothetical protein E2C01_026241 [Portunus trituberculatus]|uniref:Uncharacterized protein n=1 Tax=Portunus trituberculatus TaxID=210409 RepID=A0A5B7EI14_PORTR|nr:hypothetical protein [Portunus trituberculatus]
MPSAVTVLRAELQSSFFPRGRRNTAHSSPPPPTPVGAGRQGRALWMSLSLIVGLIPPLIPPLSPPPSLRPPITTITAPSPATRRRSAIQAEGEDQPDPTRPYQPWTDPTTESRF